MCSPRSESPAFRLPIRSRPFLDKFNFVWSYNTDLLLHTTYLTRMAFEYRDFSYKTLHVPFEQKEEVPLMTLFSNCDNRFGRMTLVERLMKHTDIHNYGKCFNNRAKPPREEMSTNRLVGRYKFVLAMENSICTDYVTEKWTRALRVGTIPLVVSCNNTPNYAKFSPTVTPVHINACDFKSVELLARKIHEIAAEKSLFLKFMRYRNMDEVNMKRSFQDLMARKFIRRMEVFAASRRLCPSQASLALPMLPGGGPNLSVSRVPTRCLLYRLSAVTTCMCKIFNVLVANIIYRQI